MKKKYYLKIKDGKITSVRKPYFTSGMPMRKIFLEFLKYLFSVSKETRKKIRKGMFY